MKTSCFKLYKGDKGCSICCYPPIDWTDMTFPALEPRRQDFFAIKNGQINEEEYEKNYRDHVLSKLDPRKTYETLKNVVLLCWEEPKWEKGRTSGDFFCHRRIVAKWVFENLKIIVPEWDPSEEKNTEKSEKRSLF